MNKALIVSSIFGLGLLMASPSYASYGSVACQPIYGGGQTCATTDKITLDKKAMLIHILTENDMRMESIIDIIRQRMIKQNLNPLCLDFGKEQFASGMMIKKDIKVKEGVDKDVARKIIKDIKDSKLKVQAQMMDDQVRVTAKKIDDLQAVISLVRQGSYDLPLQFLNMKS